MSEFHYNLTPAQVQSLIDGKIAIYKDYDQDFTYLPFDNIIVPNNSIVYRALKHAYSKQGVNLDNYILYKHNGISMGNPLYEFFNIVSK